MAHRTTVPRFRSSSPRKALPRRGSAFPPAPRPGPWPRSCEPKRPVPSRHGAGALSATMKSSTTQGRLPRTCRTRGD
eukprot:1815344-Alexandrium_andersonii.AAC.1